MLLTLFLLFIFSTKTVLAAPYLDNSTAATANFTSMGVSFTGQSTTAIIGDSNNGNTIGIKVGDSGSSGWAATMTATNLTVSGSVKKLAGTNSTVGFTGIYDGVPGVLSGGGFFTVEITTGGSVGVAVFSWTDPLGVATTDVTTASSMLLSNGISVIFDPATYVIGDKWSVAVDVFPYTGLTVTPSSIFAEFGTLTGVTAGGSGTLTGSGINSDAKTIMTATAGNGTGAYWQDLDLNLNIHTNPLSGSFSGVVVLTVL